MTRTPPSDLGSVREPHTAYSFRFAGDVAYSVTSNLPHAITFAGKREAMLALAQRLREAAADIEAANE